MRQRRRMNLGVGCADRLDVGQIGQRHRHQIAVRQHRALRPAGGAARVKQPGEIVGASRHDIDAVALAEAPPFGAGGDDGAAMRRDIVGEVGARQDQRRLRMPDNVTELVGVQLGVHRHRDESGVPDRKQRFEKFRAIAHGDRHPILRPAQRAQVAGEDARARCPLPITGVSRRAHRDRGILAGGAAPFFHPAGEVHCAIRACPSLPVSMYFIEWRNRQQVQVGCRNATAARPIPR